MSEFLKETETEIKLRKYKNALVICGKGIILFSVWSIIRATMYFFLLDKYIGNIKENLSLEDIPDGFVIASIYLILALELLVRYLVGKKAIKVGRGEKQTVLFVIASIVIAAVSLFSVITFFQPGSQGLYADKTDMIISFILELSVTVNEIEIVLFAALARYWEKKCRKEREAVRKEMEDAT